MVIQSYSVSASSQRTSISLEATATASPRNTQQAQVLGISTMQEESAAEQFNQALRRQNQNGNDQGQNQNGQGQNKNGQGQNDQGQNVNNQGQNQNGQGQNVNNQGQNDDDIIKETLEKAKNDRDEALHRMGRLSSAPHLSKGKYHKIAKTPQELRARMMQAFYELLTGMSFKLKPPAQNEHINEGRGLGAFNFIGDFFGVGGIPGISFADRLQGLNGVSAVHFQYESETVSYQAQGIVKTADGREISVDINMHMSREFVSYMNISTNTSALVDPIVINYGGTAASLLGEKFTFDLTMDGNLDSLSVLGEGSGFLAIDWNGNGQIDDGSELFGPSTGCGFTELRKYDTDGNGWIDENDEIFDKLVVWRRDQNGNDTVYTLRELDIGAIFLGDIKTEYSFKGDNNETLGVMRSTSFFIKECGGTGTLSHIDLSL